MRKSHVFVAIVMAFSAHFSWAQVQQGSGASAGGFGQTAVGDLSFAGGSDGTANGFSASAVGNRSTAVGANATATGSNSVSVGAGSDDAGRNNVVSVGSASQQRTIVNVAAGDVSATSTDAVNGAQLNAVSSLASHAYGVAQSAHERIDSFDARLTRGLADQQRFTESATAAALAIPSTPSNIPAGRIWAGTAIGMYGGSTAVGVSAAYQYTERVNFSAGVAKGDRSKSASRVQAGFLF